MVAQVHEQARRMGALRAVALCRCFSGALHFQNGDWGRAEADLTEAVDLYRKLGGASGESLSLQRLGVLLTARGDLDGAMSLLEEGALTAERATMRSHCLTRLYASMARNRLAANDIDAAQEYMRDGELTAQRHGHCVTCNALLLPEAVRVLIAAGDIEAARARAATLDGIARDFGSTVWLAMSGQAHGRVAAAGQKWAEAADHFAAASEAFTAAGAPYDAARCRSAEAEAVGRLGDAARAAALEELARAAFARLGATAVEN